MMTSLCTILNLRTQFEDVTTDFNMGCQVPKGGRGSCINTIEWFIDNGHRSNSLRNGFQEAMDIALTIKEYSDGAQDFRTWESV